MYKFEYTDAVKNLAFTYTYVTGYTPIFLVEEIEFAGRRLTKEQALKAIAAHKALAEILVAPFIAAEKNNNT